MNKILCWLGVHMYTVVEESWHKIGAHTWYTERCLYCTMEQRIDIFGEKESNVHVMCV